jgi:hypothetical protein
MMVPGSPHVHTALLATLLAAVSASAERASGPPVHVSTEEILQGMREVRGYSLTATANGARLEADVIFSTIREAAARDPERRPLFFGHQEWYDAFLARTGLAPGEAPLYVRLSHQIGQDMIVDYRRENVIDGVLEGPQPQFAANVWIFWKGGPDQYSYDDTQSRPNLRVTQKRLIRYRLVKYDGVVWYAEVSGLHGRPTTGPLGVLFALVGEARVEESRSTVLPDGLQIVRGRGSKWGMHRTATVTIWPDGHADKGVPAGRPDVVEAAARLEEPLAIRFRPMPPTPA